MLFSKVLNSWYVENKRELPWRLTRDPYKVWLSEIILQQTRVEQGKPYYGRFVKAFPTIFDLANSSEEEVLKLWQGLGYYSRARNLHAAAKYIVTELNGDFPASYEELLKLKGVGDYTASAVSSICYNEPVAVVDGNVFRVLSRIFGIDTPVNTTEGAKKFKSLAQDLLDKKDPSSFNQGLMEFGALHCKPQLPCCSSCPFAPRCVAHNQGRISELPVKLKKQKVKTRHFNYIVPVSNSRETMLQQRKGKGIWRGLYEFPLIETSKEATKETLMGERVLQSFEDRGSIGMKLFNEEPIVHKLSHQHIHTKFWILDCKGLPGNGIPLEKLADFPVPVLIGNFIDSFEV